MFCSQCGMAVEASAKFCRNCGTASESAQVPRPGNAGDKASRGFEGLADLVDAPAQAAGVAHESPPLAASAKTSTIASDPADESRAFLGGSRHPWRRYFAKLLDVVILGVAAFIVVMIGLTVIAGDTGARFLELMDNEVLATMVMLALWIPTESLLLATVGTTPARALFGIKLRRQDGSRLSFTDALARSAMVVIQGMGFGIPIVTMFTQYFAYRRLTKTGTTLWDAEGACEVTHATWGAGRAIACVAVWVVVFLVTIAASEAGT